MKILISVDIEGVAGVFHPQQTRAGNPEYERARRLMTDEANAAIAGAFEGGASEVYVNDSHGDFRNMPPDLLDDRARVVQGKPRYLGMASGAELGIDGMCMVGYHSRARGRGILAHTINSFAFAAVELNGEVVGEAILYGALAGELGVPVLMGSGDDVFIDENRSAFPHAVWVRTKRATGHTSGVSLSPAAACAAIRRGVVDALGKAADATPLSIALPVTVTLHTQTAALADLFCQWPTLHRIDASVLRFEASTVQDAVRMLNSCSAMSALLR
ncbi:MAG: aminopeptidase [Comamonadaceae bacterium]|nr:MAG: aminopeptidase [Comamonadaceae bacterium]